MDIIEEVYLEVHGDSLRQIRRRRVRVSGHERKFNNFLISEYLISVGSLPDRGEQIWFRNEKSKRIVQTEYYRVLAAIFSV